MEKNLDNLIDFFHIMERLKLEKRKGWIDRGVKNGESVAGHSLRLALMALIFAENQGLDACKAVKMAIVHDIPEAICGDIATRIREELQEIPNHEKHEREEKALEQELKLLPKGTANEIRQLWNEFEKRESKEARLVYELDRLEAIFQAVEYEERKNFKVSLQEFFDYANGRLKNKFVLEMFNRLMEKRQNLP